MSDQAKPIVIEAESKKTEQTHHHGESTIRSSKERLKAIASEYNVDALLHDVEQEDIAHRTAHRQRQIMQRQQANLERIVELAYAACQDETAKSPDPDWLVRFFDLARNIYGHGMQNLWAKILKQELIRPGSTSLKALNILETMTQREAQALQRACAIASTFGSDTTRKLITGYRRKGGLVQLIKPEPAHKLALGNYQLSYTDLLLLMDLGLILRTELESGEIDMEPPLPLKIQHKQYMITPLAKGMKLFYYRFSPTGNELAKLVGKRVHDDYHNALIELLAQGFDVQSEKGSTLNTHA